MNSKKSSLLVVEVRLLFCLLVVGRSDIYGHYHGRVKLQEGAECEGADGAKGVCTSLEKCSFPTYAVTKLPSCSDSPGSHIVCCPTISNPLASRHRRYTWQQAPSSQTQQPTWLNSDNSHTHQDYHNGYSNQNSHNGYNNQYWHNGYNHGYPHQNYDNGYNDQNWHINYNDHAGQNWHNRESDQNENQHSNHNLHDGYNSQFNNGNSDSNLQNGNIGQTTQTPVSTGRNSMTTIANRSQGDTTLPTTLPTSQMTSVTNQGPAKPVENATQTPFSLNNPYVEPNPVPSALSGTRISERKCVEYHNHMRKLTEEYDTLGKARCTWHADPNRPKQIYFPIYLGRNSTFAEFPHMVALGWPLKEGGFEFKCGGTVISELYILTAGHCLSVSNLDNTTASLEPTIVRLGDNILNDSINDGADPITIGVKRIIRHPRYKPPVKYFDIGLIKMAEKVKFTLEIRPACLWTEPGFGPYKHGVVTGWGRLAAIGQIADMLQAASLELYENPMCAPLLETARNRNWKTGLADTQLCAGDLINGTDTCQGDSGSALSVAYHDNQCLFFVMGVTSFGRPCGTLNSPGVYTRVSSFVDWIESVVWSDSSDAKVSV